MKNFPKGTIVRSKRDGQRYLSLGDYQMVPVGIAALAAGKDAWMRDVLIKCGDCQTKVRLGDTETDLCLCRACVDKAEDENAKLDAGE